MVVPTYTGAPGARNGDRYERAAGTSGLTIANMGEME